MWAPTPRTICVRVCVCECAAEPRSYRMNPCKATGPQRYPCREHSTNARACTRLIHKHKCYISFHSGTSSFFGPLANTCVCVYTYMCTCVRVCVDGLALVLLLHWDDGMAVAAAMTTQPQQQRMHHAHGLIWKRVHARARAFVQMNWELFVRTSWRVGNVFSI